MKASFAQGFQTYRYVSPLRPIKQVGAAVSYAEWRSSLEYNLSQKYKVVHRCFGLNKSYGATTAKAKEKVDEMDARKLFMWKSDNRMVEEFVYLQGHPD